MKNQIINTNNTEYKIGDVVSYNHTMSAGTIKEKKVRITKVFEFNKDIFVNFETDFGFKRSWVYIENIYKN